MLDENKVRKAVFLYGYVVVLYLLENEERLEKYENCAVIKKILDAVIKEYELDFTTKTNPKNIIETYRQTICYFNNPEIIYHNMPTYVEECREYLELKA